MPKDEMPTSGESNTKREAVPRWVLIFAFVLALLAMILVLMQMTGDHGPGRHFRSPAAQADSAGAN